MPLDSRFWETKTLEEMSTEEWEALCDGCAKCCLFKIEDIDTGEIFFTNVICRLLDLGTCRCQDYPNRVTVVPDCLQLTPAMVHEINWLPESCAYRRLAEGRRLDWWHPLVSGDPNTIHKMGRSVMGKVVIEEDVDMEDLEDMVVDWFD